MAQETAGERTEKPTEQRLRRAREQGQVAQSAEVPSALAMLGLLAALALCGPALGQYLAGQVRQGLSFKLDGPLESDGFWAILHRQGVGGLLAILPFVLAGAAASVVGGVVVGGLGFSPKALRLNLSRLSPVAGFKNLFSTRSAVTVLVSVAKLIVILLIVHDYLKDKVQTCLDLRYAAPAGILASIGALLLGVAARITIALLAIATADLVWQLWKHRRDLRMTKQELKQELKEHEISPQVKGRIRSIQMEMARRRMLQEVPKADVVVANPTHVAVALRYEPSTMQAPQVVAKGADLLSQTIREIAAAHGVPILYRPELARTLFATVEVGQAVPETLFVAVAEVLALIYRLKPKAHRPVTAPRLPHEPGIK